MPTCSPETATLLAQPEPTECRIEWAIPGYGTGSGDWWPILARGILEDFMSGQIARYGPGTHWIITR